MFIRVLSKLSVLWTKNHYTRFCIFIFYFRVIIFIRVNSLKFFNYFLFIEFNIAGTDWTTSTIFMFIRILFKFSVLWTKNHNTRLCIFIFYFRVIIFTPMNFLKFFNNFSFIEFNIASTDWTTCASFMTRWSLLKLTMFWTKNQNFSLSIFVFDLRVIVFIPMNYFEFFDYFSCC